MRRSRRWVTVLTIALACVLGLASLVVWTIQDLDKHLTLYEGTVPSTSSQAFVSETEALRLADQAMIAAGHSLEEWRPVDYGSQTAPDGRPEKFVNRGNDPNSVSVQYQHPTQVDGYRDVFVRVERTEDGYKVTATKGK